MQGLEYGTMVRDKWFHTYKENGDITYQGHVLDYLPPRLVLVQLFSWIDGEPTCQKLLEVTDEWSFYDTMKSMHNAWNHHLEYYHHITPLSDSQDNYKHSLFSTEYNTNSPNGNIIPPK